MESDNVFVSRMLQPHGPLSDALVARCMELLDSGEFIHGVTRIRNDYADQYQRAVYWDGQTYTEASAQLEKLASNCEKLAELLGETARSIMADGAKLRLVLNSVNDEALGRILSLCAGDFDASLARLSHDLRQAVTEYGLIKKGGEKALSAARRDHLVRPLARLFEQYSLRAENYSKDGSGKPSQLAAFARLIASDVGDTSATPAALGQIDASP